MMMSRPALPYRPMKLFEKQDVLNHCAGSCGKLFGLQVTSGTRPGLRAGKLESGGWIERIAALHGDNAVGLPSAEYRVYHRRTVSAERAAVSVWQVVGVAGDEAVSRIEGGEPALQAEVGDRHDRPVPQRGVVDRLGKRVRAQKAQSVREAFFHAQLQGVIHRRRARRTDIDGRVHRILAQRLREGRRGRRLVVIVRVIEVRALGANVSGGYADRSY